MSNSRSIAPSKRARRSPSRISSFSGSLETMEPRASLRSPSPVRWAPRSLQVEVPEEYEQRLCMDLDEGNPLLRLMLAGTTAGFPFLTQLYRQHEVKSRMIKVWLEYDEDGAQYGQILIEISGPNADGPAPEAFFRQHGIGVEFLGYV